MIEPAETETSSGCGVTGCLYGAVAFFAILLILVLLAAVIRFSRPPQPRLAPSSPGVLAPDPPAEFAPNFVMR